MLGAQDGKCPEQAAKSQKPKTKRGLQEIWMAETRAEAVVAFDAFIENYG